MKLADMRIVQLANELVLKNPDIELLRLRPLEEYPALPRILQSELQKSHLEGKLILPNLRSLENKNVAVFSDYSGEGSGDFYAYSVLVCGWQYIGATGKRLREIREKYRLGEKEISFKSFKMVRRILPEYLKALDDLLLGFLCTIVVDKKLVTLFGSSEKQTTAALAEMLETENVGHWKRDVAEKMLRVVHMATYLTALLAHDGQKIFWMTDHDSICANSEMHLDLLKLFGRVLGIYKRADCTFPDLGGAVPFEERALEFLDLLSAADVVSSSLAHYFTLRSASTSHDEIVVKPGAEEVIRWLAADGVGLKKATFLIRPGQPGTLEHGRVDFTRKDIPANSTFVPIYM